MRRPLRLLCNVVTTLSLTGATAGAIGYHLLAQPVRPVLAPAPPLSNPAPVAVPAGHWFTETEINGSAVCMARTNIVSFPPMFTVPIATAVLPATSANAPAASGNPSGGGGYYGGP